MPSPEQHRARPPARRWQALLVLSLLAGLLGMHALAPGGLAPEPAQHRLAATPLVADDGDCPGGRCGGCLVQHADSACASAAVAGGPHLPVPTSGPVVLATQADAVRPYRAASSDATRAPPSLAELQLLRI
ncbi:DUF6153 family protein [Streptomyces sp. NPDC008092]|uniref:DUF6153 family protein n=1 Tax=Streptomyces sp. NPDC008092 TaxID=3364808 RepID=UPI0036E6ACEE